MMKYKRKISSKPKILAICIHDVFRMKTDGTQEVRYTFYLCLLCYVGVGGGQAPGQLDDLLPEGGAGDPQLGALLPILLL